MGRQIYKQLNLYKNTGTHTGNAIDVAGAKRRPPSEQ